MGADDISLARCLPVKLLNFANTSVSTKISDDMKNIRRYEWILKKFQLNRADFRTG